MFQCCVAVGSAFRFAKNHFDSIHARKLIQVDLSDSVQQLGLQLSCSDSNNDK